MLLFNPADKELSFGDTDFNTSNVTIQPSAACDKHVDGYNFNTSNVTIQHKTLKPVFYS